MFLRVSNIVVWACITGHVLNITEQRIVYYTVYILYIYTQHNTETIRMAAPISGCSGQWVRSPTPALRPRQWVAHSPSPKGFSKGGKDQAPPDAREGMEASTPTAHSMKPKQKT